MTRPTKPVEYYVDDNDLTLDFEVINEKVIAFDKTNFEFRTDKIGFNFLFDQN